MTVKDLDSLADNYDVWNINRGYIGHKYKLLGDAAPKYKKPNRPGLRWDQREYKKTPPWFGYEVVKIATVSGRLVFEVTQEGTT